MEHFFLWAGGTIFILTVADIGRYLRDIRDQLRIANKRKGPS